MKSILLLILLWPFAARGDELSLLINGHAHHMGTSRHLNDRNTGVGLQYDFSSSDKWRPFVTASGFKDSLWHESYYAGGGVMRQVGPVNVGVVAFAMTRKNYKNDRLFFGALPVINVGYVNLTYVPKVEPKMIPLWFLQLKLPF